MEKLKDEEYPHNSPEQANDINESKDLWDNFTLEHLLNRYIEETEKEQNAKKIEKQNTPETFNPWDKTVNRDYIVNKSDNTRVNRIEADLPSVAKLLLKKIRERFINDLSKDLEAYESEIKANPRKASSARNDENDFSRKHLYRLREIQRVLTGENNNDWKEFFYGINDAIKQLNIPFLTKYLYDEADLQRMYDLKDSFPIVNKGKDLVDKYEKVEKNFMSDKRKQAGDMTDLILNKARNKVINYVPYGNLINTAIDSENFANFRENKRANPEMSTLENIGETYLKEIAEDKIKDVVSGIMEKMGVPFDSDIMDYIRENHLKNKNELNDNWTNLLPNPAPKETLPLSSGFDSSQNSNEQQSFRNIPTIQTFTPKDMERWYPDSRNQSKDDDINRIYPSVNKQRKKTGSGNYDTYVKITDSLNSYCAGAAPMTVVRDALDFMYELTTNGVSEDLLSDSIDLLRPHRGYTGEACYIPSLNHIYLIADRISDRSHLEKIWLHENIHAAIRAMNTGYASRIMKQIYESVGESGMKEVIPSEYFEENNDKESLTHEYIARLAQDYIPKRGIRDFFKKKLFTEFDEEQKEVNLFLKQLFDYLIHGDGGIQHGLTDGTSRFSSDSIKSLFYFLKKAGLECEIITDKELFDNNIVKLWLYGYPLIRDDYKPYGFIMPDGQLWIDCELIRKNTPINKPGHLWVNSVKTGNRNLYEQGVSLIRNSPYCRNVKNNVLFASQSPDKIYFEALSAALSDKGRAGLYAGSCGKRIAEWNSEVWEWLASKLNINEITPVRLQNLTLDELAKVIKA